MQTDSQPAATLGDRALPPEWVTRVVDAAPPLTLAQHDTLAALAAEVRAERSRAERAA